MEIVASSANIEFLALAPGPENRGAGGSGRRGLPPYRELGVPGLEAPLISDGSKLMFGGGGRIYSALPRLGLQLLVGEFLPLGE